jgi:hypothetical protein
MYLKRVLRNTFESVRQWLHYKGEIRHFHSSPSDVKPAVISQLRFQEKILSVVLVGKIVGGTQSR